MNRSVLLLSPLVFVSLFCVCVSYFCLSCVPFPPAQSTNFLGLGLGIQLNLWHFFWQCLNSSQTLWIFDDSCSCLKPLHNSTLPAYWSNWLLHFRPRNCCRRHSCTLPRFSQTQHILPAGSRFHLLEGVNTFYRTCRSAQSKRQIWEVCGCVYLYVTPRA